MENRISLDARLMGQILILKTCASAGHLHPDQRHTLLTRQDTTRALKTQISAWDGKSNAVRGMQRMFMEDSKKCTDTLSMHMRYRWSRVKAELSSISRIKFRSNSK